MKKKILFVLLISLIFLENQTSSRKNYYLKREYELKKSLIQETLNILMFVNGSTDTKTARNRHKGNHVNHVNLRMLRVVC